MGIYINGIEMPTGNHEIIVRIQSDGRVLDQWGHRFNQEFIAVPVPPHGRLIDADAIFGNRGVGTQIAGWGKMFRETVIEFAPTIIPASEEDE